MYSVSLHKESADGREVQRQKQEGEDRKRKGEREEDKIAVHSPVRVVPTAGEGLTAMSSHRKQAHSSRSIRLTPARDLTVWRRYLQEGILCDSLIH